jgi:hypothetical protein
VKTRDFSPDPRTGVKISAFPATLEDRKLTLSSRDLLDQRGIVATSRRTTFAADREDVMLTRRTTLFAIELHSQRVRNNYEYGKAVAVLLFPV